MNLRSILRGAAVSGLLQSATALGALTSEQQAHQDRLLEASRQQRLASEPQWQYLGHYKKGWLGGKKSEVAAQSFFLAPKGETDPEAELVATIRGLFFEGEREYEGLYRDEKTGQPKIDRQHPRCQFPARVAFLKKHLPVDESLLPPADCARFEKFRADAGTKSASVVFSSYYLNNPSSAFGHSLLRLNRSELGTRNRDRYELLDRGINFAAEVTTDNSLVYAFNGLMGLFRGTYSDIPYYYKVREYNDHESRDLWSYDLNLTPEETEMLVAHVWELGTAHFRYLYLTQNCSYQILTAIEAAAPRYEITRNLKYFIIPGDTIKQLMRTPGLVHSVSYRPSVRSTFDTRLTLLSAAEKAALKSLVVARAEPASDSAGLPQESRVRVLDAALDYLDFKHAKDMLKPESEAAQFKQKVLIARATTGGKSAPLSMSPPVAEQPQSGHDSARLSIEGGSETGRGAYSQLGFRFALHDLLDAPSGYPELSQIEMGNALLRYSLEQRKVELEDFALVRVLSINPLSEFNRERSWRVDLGLRRVRDANCDRCLAGNFELGTGYAVTPWSAIPLTAYSLIEAEVSYSPGFTASDLRLGAGPQLGLHFGRGALRLLTRGSYHYEWFATEPHVVQWRNEARWVLQNNFSVGGRFSMYNGSSVDGGLAAYYHF